MNYVEFAVAVESGRCVCRSGGFPISTLLEQRTAFRITKVLNILIKFVAKIFDVKSKIKYNYKQRFCHREKALLSLIHFINTIFTYYFPIM